MTNPNLSDVLSNTEQQEQANEVSKDDEISTDDLDDVAGGLQADCKAMACGVF